MAQRLEFHQLDCRLEHLRVRHPLRFRRLLASLAEAGQQTPILVIQQADRYLVIVCRDDGTGSPDVSGLVAFLVKGTQAINYDVGTWHHGMVTIGRPGLFAMLVFENGSPDDCHFRSIMPVEVSL